MHNRRDACLVLGVPEAYSGWEQKPDSFNNCGETTSVLKINSLMAQGDFKLNYDIIIVINRLWGVLKCLCPKRGEYCLRKPHTI